MVSKISIHTLSSLIIAAGIMFLPATAKAEQGMSSQFSSVGSGSDISVPKVQSHPGSGVTTQWSDQLTREREGATKS